MNTNDRWPLAALAAAVLAACTPRAALPAPPDDRPHAIAFEPGDELTRVDEAIRIRFDRPMVPIDAVGPALSPVPVHVEPELPLRAHWEDAKTLLLRPELEWKSSTRYTLALDAKLAQPLKLPHSWTFDVQPLRLQGSSASGDNISRSPELMLYFNAEVDPRAVAQRCVLEPVAGKRVALRLVPKKNEAPRPRHVTLTPVARLPELTHYVVDCPGLTGRIGSAPFRLARDRAQGFITHGPLKVMSSKPAQGSASAPERATICLQLSTPVSLEQMAAHVHVSPQPEGLAQNWYQGACNPEEWNDTDRANGIVLAPRRGYRVFVDAELTDEFGQQLGRAHVWTFETSDRMPGLWSNEGTASVFELGQSGHGVGALNMPAVSMSCAQLTPVQLVTEFTTISNWLNEWVDAPAEQRSPAPWAALGIPALTHSLDTSVAVNAGRNVEIDLGARCGGKAAGAPGLYASALEPSGLPAERELQGYGRARLLANVTDLALVAKRGERTGLVWVTRFSNGALVPGATVQALDADGRVLATARSDAQGLARFP
ncbi:MAG TPA: hypothetical protein VK509_08555, partial [Polyangiales bacterium]|nr:hypothetical protein [Polyangiales bacterium]